MFRNYGDLTRRSLLELVASVPIVMMSYGCGRKEDVLYSNVVIDSFEDALEISLEKLERRHRETFHLVDEFEPEIYQSRPKHTGYYFCLAPDKSSEQYFSVLLSVLDSNNELDGHINSDYSQWLFKDKAEKPFRDIVTENSTVIGFATRLIYARLDYRVWSSNEFQEYMGKGGKGEPQIDVFAFLDEESEYEETLETIKHLQDTIWKVKNSSCLYVTRKGCDPRKDWLYQTDSSNQMLAFRKEAPTVEEIERQLRWRYPLETTHEWDGTPTIGDPSDVNTLPQVTWI